MNVTELKFDMYDLIIIGAGPAGSAAAVYAARKRLRTLFLSSEWGGQSTDSTDIQNWIGTISISGHQFAKDLEAHVRAYASDCVEIKTPVKVTHVAPASDGIIEVTTETGEHYQSRSALIATGSRRRKLDIPGAETFEHKGVTYCASCDGPMFSGQRVAVIGGGNAGFESAAQLLAYTEHVTILQRGDQYTADPVTVERVLAHDNVTGLTNVLPTKILGDSFVSGVTYLAPDGTEQTINVAGIFVEIGLLPNTDLVADIVERDTYNRIVIDPWSQKTSVPGIWAAGDCTNILYHQNNISAGHAVTALEDIYVTLSTK